MPAKEADQAALESVRAVERAFMLGVMECLRILSENDATDTMTPIIEMVIEKLS